MIVVFGNCHNCLLWRKFADADHQPGTQSRGTCVRFPPVLDPTYIRPNGSAADPSDNPCSWIQPVTEAFDGCGEWQAYGS